MDKWIWIHRLLWATVCTYLVSCGGPRLYTRPECDQLCPYPTPEPLPEATPSYEEEDSDFG
jgi:hypothetical protein